MKLEKYTDPKHFLHLSTSELKTWRDYERARIESVCPALRQHQVSVLKDVQYLREMYEDGILMLGSLNSPLIKLEAVKLCIEKLLAALNKHIKIQEILFEAAEEECSKFSSNKHLKQELADTIAEDKVVAFTTNDSVADDVVEDSCDRDDTTDNLVDSCDTNERSGKRETVALPENGDIKTNLSLTTDEFQIGKTESHEYLKAVDVKLEQPSQGNPKRIKNLRNKSIGEQKENASFKCQVCDRYFVCRTKFKEHTRRHTGERPYKCDQCFKGFATKGNLTAHLVVHTKDKAFHCDFCPKKFSRKVDLDRHILIHTGERPYRCEFCFMSFTTNSNLVKHVRVHTGERPYACQTCNKSFVSKGGLDDHQRIHTGEKPYQCDTCKKYFRKSTHLKTHIRTHTGVKPFQCEICEKFFTRKANLREHMNTHSKG